MATALAALVPHVDETGRITMASKINGADPHELADKAQATFEKPAEKVQVEIDKRLEQRATLQEGKNLVKALSTAADPLARAQSDILKDSAFEAKTALVSGEQKDHVSVIISGKPQSQTVTLGSITQLAAPDRMIGTTDFKVRDYAISADAITADTGAALGWTGNLVLRYEGEVDSNKFELPLNAGMSLQDIATVISLDPNYEAEPILQKGTTSYQLLIQADAGQGGKTLVIDSSAVVGPPASHLPVARFGSVSESGVVAGNTSALNTPPANTFSEATASIDGFMDGKVSTVSVSGTGPYDISIDVLTDGGTATLSATGFTPALGGTLTLSNATTGATFSIDCDGADISGLGSATDISTALKQLFGLNTGAAVELISPSAALTNGLYTGYISADVKTVSPGTYAARYDQASKTFIVSDGKSTSTSTAIAASGEQTVTVNGITFSLQGDFDQDTDMGWFKFDVKGEGTSPLDTLSEAAGWHGELVVGTAEGQSTSFTIEPDWSMTKILNTVNSKQTETGVVATMVGNRIQLHSREMATPLNIDISNLKGVDTDNITGVSYANAAAVAARKDALSSKFSVNGQNFTEPSRTVEVVQGITVELVEQTTSDVTIVVDESADGVAKSIRDFVKSLNDVMDFLKTQQTDPEELEHLSDEEKAQYGILRNTREVSSVFNQLLSTSTQNIAGIDEGKLASLANMGITYDLSTKQFVIDNATLTNAIINQYDELKDVFTFSHTVSDSNAMLTAHKGWLEGVYKQSDSTVPADTVSLSFSKDGAGLITGTYTVEGNTYDVEVKQMGTLVHFKGLETNGDSAVDGLVVTYPADKITTNSAFTVDITGKRGIAGELVRVADNLTAKDTGTFDLASKRLETQDESAKHKIEDIKERAKINADRVRTSLLKLAEAQAQADKMREQMDMFLSALNPEKK